MILDVLAYKNKAAGMFANPFYSQEKLENAEVNMSRALIINGPELQAKYKHLALYKLGTFDDVKGTFDVLKEPEFIFDCDDIIDGIKGGNN